MQAAVAAIEDPKKERQTIYAVLDELGVSYRKTNCGKCLRDLLNIAREELGLIADASAESEFNGDARYEYLKDVPYQWRGNILNDKTPSALVEAFMANHPRAGEFFRKIEEITENTYTENDSISE